MKGRLTAALKTRCGTDPLVGAGRPRPALPEAEPGGAPRARAPQASPRLHGFGWPAGPWGTPSVAALATQGAEKRALLGLLPNFPCQESIAGAEAMTKDIAMASEAKLMLDRMRAGGSARYAPLSFAEAVSNSGNCRVR
jgi:hypothetical protein